MYPLRLYFFIRKKEKFTARFGKNKGTPSPTLCVSYMDNYTNICCQMNPTITEQTNTVFGKLELEAGAGEV